MEKIYGKNICQEIEELCEQKGEFDKKQIIKILIPKYEVDYKFKKGIRKLNFSYNIDKKYLKVITTENNKNLSYDTYTKIIQHIKEYREFNKDKPLKLNKILGLLHQNYV